jgi:hypothetical protein
MELAELVKQNRKDVREILDVLIKEQGREIAWVFSRAIDMGKVSVEAVQSTRKEILAMQELLALSAYWKDIAGHYLVS